MARPLEKDVPPDPDMTADIQKLMEAWRSGEKAGHSYVVLLGLRTFDTAGVRECVHRGLSYRSFERFLRNLGMPQSDAAEWIQVTLRTLARRREEGQLRSDESDRLLRATRILARVIELFEGDVKRAREWLQTEQPALEGTTPLDYARTEVGAREVEALIGRLEHGVPS